MGSEPSPFDGARRLAARILRIAGRSLVVLALVLAAGAAVLSSRLFTAAVEKGLSDALMASRQRQLAFDDPLEVFFWPNAGFRVGRVRMTERDSEQEFASLASARFSVAVAPLLGGRVRIDECVVDGLRLSIVKLRDGSLNIDDLFAADEKSSGAQVTIDLAGLALTGSRIIWSDTGRGTAKVFDPVELRSGHVLADMGSRTLRIDDLAFSAKADDVSARLTLSGLATSSESFAAERLALELATPGIAAAIAAPLAGDRKTGTVVLDPLDGQVEVVHARLLGPLKLPLRGALRAGRNGSAGRLETHFDDSRASFQLSFSRYAPLAVHFDAEVDELDLGRYLAPRRNGATSDADPRGNDEKAPAHDFSALRNIDLDGTAKIGHLKIAGVETRNIKLEIRNANGELEMRGAGRAP